MGTVNTLRIALSSTAGEVVDPVGLVGFNPQPEPPGADRYGFNPQPEPPDPDSQGLLVPMVSGGEGLGGNTLTVTVEILDGVGTPMPLALVPLVVPQLGPWGLAFLATALAASGLVATRARSRR